MQLNLVVAGLALLAYNLQAQVSFAPAVAYAVGKNPHSVTTADVNGDGKLDLICANSGTNTLSVLTNDGNGGFLLAATLTVGSNPYSVVAADVNGDGKPDLICANSGTNTLSVLTNNGSGGFVLASMLVVGIGPQWVVATDVNRDGALDLICANWGANTTTLVVLINDGTGNFGPPAIYPLSDAPNAVAAADLNGDGNIELVSSLWDTTTLIEFANNGSGIFHPNATLTVGPFPYSVMATDVNGDGRVDLICANAYNNTLSVLTNDGGGRFATACSPVVGPEPCSVAAADLDGDGRVDLVCANNGSYGSGNTLSVLTNRGGGAFGLAASPTVGTGPCSVVACDVNGDGNVDLVSANSGNNTVSVLLNNHGSIRVAISPSGAVSAGAQWQVDGGPWQTNGATVAGLMPGTHSLAFTTIDGWVAPASQGVTISASRITQITGTYNQFGSLQVNLGPNGAVSAGAQWQVDGGNWQASGATVGGLIAGDHSVTFSTVGGWTTPLAQVVAISVNQTNSTTGVYVQQFGSLQENLGPDGAVSAGAKWQVDGGNWQASGATITGLALGSHTVCFSVVPGWGVPASQAVTVNYDETMVATAAYLEPHGASAMATVTNDFLVATMITDGGVGYTNTPFVYIVGGGGSGAKATAVVSNGVVTGITILNAGFGYTNIPIIAIAPPFPLMLGIGPATSLGFTNLGVGTNYQLQAWQAGTWGNVGATFVAGSNACWQFFDGWGANPSFRLVALPIPYGAIASPILAYGFVVSATVSDGGFGYVSVPNVAIMGGGGSGAQATATVSNGVVTAVEIMNAGFGYTGTPTIQIDPPPIPSLVPNVAEAVRLDYSGLTPALTYQLQETGDLANWADSGPPFTATGNMRSQYANADRDGGFFHLSLPQK
jgi:hypothetical protein